MINHTKEMNKEFLLSLNLLNKKLPSNIELKTLYSLSNRIENNYKIYKIKKHNGKYRTIYSPNTLLKNIQRKILKNILNNKSISPYAKAYHKGICLKDNAYPHLNQKKILKLDIIDFFENIEYINIYKTCFNEIYFPKAVGHLLTYLCTYESRLPQGAPTSSYISNLVMNEFDYEIGTWCNKRNINYTRYSDDMTFSGDFNHQEVISYVRKQLYKLGLKINNKKINIIDNSQQQKVTGIIVNKKLQVSKKYRNKIRQEIYYIKKYNLSNHLEKLNIKDKTKYLNSLKGKINYVLNIDPHNKEFISYKDYLKELN